MPRDAAWGVHSSSFFVRHLQDRRQLAWEAGSTGATRVFCLVRLSGEVPPDCPGATFCAGHGAAVITPQARSGWAVGRRLGSQHCDRVLTRRYAQGFSWQATTDAQLRLMRHVAPLQETAA